MDNLLWRDRCLLQFANHKPDEIVVDVLNADDVRGDVIFNKFLNRLKRMQQMQCVAVMRPVNAVIILRQYRTAIPLYRVLLAHAASSRQST